jgi:hypothetical protein
MKAAQKRAKVHVGTSRSSKKRRRNAGTGTYMPLPQQQQAKDLYAAGKSITEIAHELKKDWRTIAKVVRSDAVILRWQGEMEARLQELLPDALATLSIGIQRGKNKETLSFGLLREVMRRNTYLAAAAAKAQQAPREELPRTEQQIEDSNQKRVKEIVAAFTEIAIETHKVFGIDMPEMDAIKNKLPAHDKKLRVAV